MHKRIAVFGGSFNPPTLAHIAVVEVLVKDGYEVVIVPCGMRPEKITTRHVDPVHRAFMVDLAFARMSHVRVEHFDLEKEAFTPTIDLDQMMKHICADQ